MQCKYLFVFKGSFWFGSLDKLVNYEITFAMMHTKMLCGCFENGTANQLNIHKKVQWISWRL